MKFFVFRVKYQLDGQIKKSEVMEYDSLRQAMAKFHNNLSLDMADETLSGSMCVVVNAYAGIEAKEHWGEITELGGE